MKWATAWWGIILTAETETDAALLESLFKLLLKEPTVKYDDGEAELVKNEKGQLELVFSR